MAEAKSLSHLTFLVIAKENPAVAHPRHMKETVLDLYNFFNKNAPDEIDRSFAKLVEVLSTPV